MRPSFMMATRSATISASSWSCVTQTTVASRLAHDARELLGEPALEQRVERGERLVEQQHARLEHERARERDPLRLAAGER